MTFLQAIILAIIEGITEFLPVSSTGHLVLAAKVLSIPQTDFVKSFEIIIQLGAILAVAVLYWRSLLRGRHVWLRILAAFIPTGIVGFTLYKLIKQYLIGNELLTLLALFVGGIMLIAIELLHKEKESSVADIEHMTFRNAACIGLFQSLSIIPGVSRSAASIIGGLVLGTKRKTAVEFSFLLAIPTMLAATGLDLLETNLRFSSYEISIIATGFIGSFVVALLAVKFFIAFIQKHTFIPFGIYRILLALLYWFFIFR